MLKNIEKEYSFIVNNWDKVVFLQQISDFFITKKKTINISELNYEKTRKHDKFKNAWVRIRKIIDKQDEKIELTYKQYLWTQNWMNNFLEMTEVVQNFSWDIFLFNQIGNLNISCRLKEMLLKMNDFCKMKPWIKIENTRNLYYYTYKNCVLEVADERIRYFLWEKMYDEKMLEIEIISELYDSKKVKEFVDYFCDKYELIIPSEWKSERVKKFLK